MKTTKARRPTAPALPPLGFRAMPVEVYVSSIHRWQRGLAENRSFEIDKKGFITADVELSTGEEITKRFGRVPRHLAFTFVPVILADWSGYVVGDPDAIRELDAVCEPLSAAWKAQDLADREFRKAASVPGLLVGLPQESSPATKPRRGGKGGRR